MSDLIKKIKIKKQDGTFTDYIPIGAEAQNVSTSDGDSVQLKLNKKPYYYDTVADMKADTKLKAGDMAITLGYYEPNDGGGGTYLIRTKTVSDVDDGGSIHQINDELVSELIVDNCVNIKQFGAKSIKVTSESNIPDTDTINTPLKNMINYVMKLARENLNKGYNFKALIPAGSYLITETIELSTLVHLIAEGSVCLYWKNTTDEENIMFKIGTTDDELSPWARHSIDNRFRNPVFDGSNGNFELNNISDTKKDTCIALGGFSDNSEGELIGLKFLYIKNFKIGIDMYLKNVYMNKFSNLSINKCEIGIKTSTPNKEEYSGINSGENIIFDKCEIALCNTAILFDDSITNLKFVNCSFDGNGCVVYQNLNLNATLIFDKCWIEAVGNSMGSQHQAINFRGKQAIVYIVPHQDDNYQLYLSTNYIFTNCRYVDSSSKYDGSKLNYLFSGNTLVLFLDNFLYETWIVYSNTTPRYLCDDNVLHINYHNYICSPYANQPFIKNKNLINFPQLNWTETGNINTTVGTKISTDFQIKSIQNISTLELVANTGSDKGNVLKITRNDNSAESTLQLITNFKVYAKNSNIRGRIYFKNQDNNKDGLSQRYSNIYYDFNDRETSRSYTEYNDNYWVADNDNYYYPSYLQSIDNSKYKYNYNVYCKPMFSIIMAANSSNIVYVKLPEVMDFSGNAVVMKDD